MALPLFRFNFLIVRQDLWLDASVWLEVPSRRVPRRFQRALLHAVPTSLGKVDRLLSSSRLVIGRMMMKAMMISTLDISKVGKIGKLVSFSRWTYAITIMILLLPVRVD